MTEQPTTDPADDDTERAAQIQADRLYGKFRVERVDGRDQPGGDKANARYFVLDYINDPYARVVLQAYADACRAELPGLAEDLAAYAAGLALPWTDQPATAPTSTCPRCGSARWVSVSLDGGYTRKAQCVPCGAYHPGVIGHGWRSPRYNDTDPSGRAS